jgi:Skp family chaperone for outer membrane proteins
MIRYAKSKTRLASREASIYASRLFFLTHKNLINIGDPMNSLSTSLRTTGVSRGSRVSQICFLALTVFALGANQAFAQTAPAVVAVINLNQVVANSPGGKALSSRLEEFQQQAQRELGVLAGKAQDVRKQVAEGANTLTQEKVAELQKDYEDQQIAIRRLQESKQREAQKLQNEGLAEIEKQLKPVIEAVRVEGGYDLILNNAPGVIVLVGPRIDITKTVIDKLNAG